eukprot:CAMPEP_0194285284 /NCGR_PEP_ID=MMETSP0169-20130528/29839_1 /TAXON_ID=218684 /ORGANISM="Corethron pennatum, Strain L29A3" /LENGTH=435 /DNA_ID=CAMNT_0039031373 /DNA_START=257 /DNA_END=1564 /DNA_ORIENTATION=+
MALKIAPGRFHSKRTSTWKKLFFVIISIGVGFQIITISRDIASQFTAKSQIDFDSNLREDQIPATVERKQNPSDKASEITANTHTYFESTLRKNIFDGLLSVYDPTNAIAPLWKCSDEFALEAADTKFAFVHVFKTAGTAVNTFLKDYAVSCGASFTKIISCTTLDADSVKARGEWKECTVLKGVQRDGKSMGTDKNRNANQKMIEQSVDIVGGHFRLGTLDYLRSKDGSKTKVRYLSYFRDAVAKYVSSIVYVKKPKNWSREQLVEFIKKEAKANAKAGKYHVKYAEYLKTPWQFEGKLLKSRDIKWVNMGKEAEELAGLIIKNLVAYNVIIGITERMPDTLEVLQHVMDPAGEATEVFTKNGMVDAKGKAKIKTSNVSPFSSSSIVEEVKKDAEAYAALVEYVKYEQMIYDFALEMHIKQHKAVMRLKNQSPV